MKAILIGLLVLASCAQSAIAFEFHEDLATLDSSCQSLGNAVEELRAFQNSSAWEQAYYISNIRTQIDACQIAISNYNVYYRLLHAVSASDSCYLHSLEPLVYGSAFCKSTLRFCVHNVVEFLPKLKNTAAIMIVRDALKEMRRTLKIMEEIEFY